MILKTEIKNNVAVVSYELKEEELQLLRHLKEHKTFSLPRMGDPLIDDLFEYGFVEQDTDAWHFTVQLAKLGKSVVEAMDKAGKSDSNKGKEDDE